MEKLSECSADSSTVKERLETIDDLCSLENQRENLDRSTKLLSLYERLNEREAALVIIDQLTEDPFSTENARTVNLLCGISSDLVKMEYQDAKF